MSNIFITNIAGSIGIPNDDAQLASATSTLDALLSGVAGLDYDRLLAWVEDFGGPDGAEGPRSLNCMVEKFTFLGKECPSESETDTMTTLIESTLEASASIDTIGVQQVNIFQTGAYFLWNRDSVGGFLYPNVATDDVAVGPFASPNAKWFSEGDLVLGDDTMAGSERLRVLGQTLMDQDSDERALLIDSEATSEPLIEFAPILANTRGDIAFGTVRTADPASPSEGDFWYNSTDNRFRFNDGSNPITLWPQPAQTVVVAEEGGDFTSIKDAVDSISDASVAKPYAVLVAAGTYTEAPITMKSYVYVQALAEFPAIVTPSDNSSPLFTMAANSGVKELYINCPSADAAITSGGGISDVVISKCVFDAVATGQTAVESTDSSTFVIVEECKLMDTVTNGMLALSDSRLDCSTILSRAVNAFYANGGTIRVRNSGAQFSTNAYYADNDGAILGTSVTSDFSDTALRLGTTGDNSIQGVGWEVRDSVTYDVLQESTTGFVSIDGARLEIDKFSVLNWANMHPNFSTTVENNERFVVTKSFDVGVAENGHDSHMGQGPSYTRGEMVITSDSTATSTTEGGNLTDVSDDARSSTGSTFTFQGTAANHCIYLGSSLSDGSDVLKHWALRISQTTAAVELVKRSFAFEIWDGAAWTEIGVMAIQASELYRYANEVFIRANSQEYVTFGIDADTTWAKKTILGDNLYWSRVRITDALTTAPVFEQSKLVPSYMETVEDGTVFLAGLARYRDTILGAGNIFGESGGVASTAVAVGTGGVPTGWNHNVKNSTLNGNGDAIYAQFTIPRGIDTGQPLELNVYVTPIVGAAGTVTLIASVLPVEVSGILEADPSGGVVPIPRTLAETEAYITNPGQTDTETFSSGTTDKAQDILFGPFDISSFYEGDVLLIRIEMDDDGVGNANVMVWVVEVAGCKFTHGERLG